MGLDTSKDIDVYLGWPARLETTCRNVPVAAVLTGKGLAGHQHVQVCSCSAAGVAAADLCHLALEVARGGCNACSAYCRLSLRLQLIIRDFWRCLFCDELSRNAAAWSMPMLSMVADRLYYDHMH